MFNDWMEFWSFFGLEDVKLSSLIAKLHCLKLLPLLNFFFFGWFNAKCQSKFDSGLWPELWTLGYPNQHQTDPNLPSRDFDFQADCLFVSCLDWFSGPRTRLRVPDIDHVSSEGIRTGMGRARPRWSHERLQAKRPGPKFWPKDVRAVGSIQQRWTPWRFLPGPEPRISTLRIRPRW